MVRDATRAGRRRAPIHGLVSLDVTEARRRLAAADPPGSFTAFIVASVGRVAAAHPEVHAYRDWRGRLVVHRHVDVATLVEVGRPDGSSFPLAHVLRDADLRDVADLGSELHRVRDDPSTSSSARMLDGAARWLKRVPFATKLMYAAMDRSVKVRLLTGTVAVTAVGMFGGGAGGFGIGFPTVPTLAVLVGGISARPWNHDGRIELRDVLDLTVTVDHLVVDGAPAARFAADLRRLVESAAVLDEPISG